MTALTRVTRGENPANSDKLNQVIDAWNGNTAGVNQGNSPLSLTAINDALNYALAIKNADAAGKGLIIYAPDGVTPLLRVDKTNGVYASPDGTAAAAPISTTTGTQTLTNKTLTSPHMTGAVVDSGGLTITAGGATITAGGLTVTAGNVGINTTPVATSALFAKGTTSDNTTYVINTQSAGGTTLFTVRSDSQIVLGAAGGLLGFFAGSGAAKQTVTGSRGANAALANLLTALAAYGLVVDSST